MNYNLIEKKVNYKVWEFVNGSVEDSIDYRYRGDGEYNYNVIFYLFQDFFGYECLVTL